MILRAIRAENFMKFSSLRLSGLPEKGVIGIEGPNESGKTTIGEAILFAFFGKTRTSLETSLSRLIRWGAEYLSVEVEFTVPGRGDFLIYREIDKYGTNFVKVIDSATRAEVAAGNVNVSEFLGRTLKFDFFEFHQSFYHDQRQGALTPESQSSFVERMTGITQIREAVASLKKDIEQLEREFAHYQKDIQRNLQQMEKYERNAAKIPELREQARKRAEEADRGREDVRRREEEVEAWKRFSEERQVVARKLEQLPEESTGAILTVLGELRERLSGLRESAAGVDRDFAEKEAADVKAQLERMTGIENMLRAFRALRADLEGLAGELNMRLDPETATSFVAEARRLRQETDRASRRKRRASIAAIFSLVAAALAGGALAAAMGKVIPAELPSMLALGGVVAATLALAVFLFAAAARAARQARNLRSLLIEQEISIREDTARRERMTAILEVSGPGEAVRLVKAAEGIHDAKSAELLETFLRGYRTLTEPEGDGEYRKALLASARLEREFRARAMRESQRVERLTQEVEGALKKLRSDLEKVENEIRECEAQAQKRETLHGKNKDLEGRSREIRGEIDLRRTAIELLDDAASSIRNKIGPSLSRFMRQMLPRLTAGRYRDIKVGNDLALQVFTSDKGDFLDRSELSGGTQEALSLALRLATSQAFIASRTRQPQFIFFDEPFKMMDEARALECLRMLSELSIDIRQFFVIQPVFENGARQQFDYMIRTAVSMNDLLTGSIDDSGGPDLPPGVRRESAASRVAPSNGGQGAGGGDGTPAVT